MRRKTGWVNIYGNTKGKAYLVFSMGMGPHGRTLIGVPVQIASDEFDARIDEALKLAFDHYQAMVGADRVWHAPEGMTSFIKKHLCVSIERRESGDLQVFPLHHKSGGYVGKEGEQIAVPAGDIPTKIASILRDAFSIAT